MNVDTAVEMLADAGYPIFKEMYSKLHCTLVARKQPFYSPEIYLNTYGQQDASVSEHITFMQSHNLTTNKRVAELFAGDAFESTILQRKYPKNKYYAVERHSYGEETPSGITYLRGDVFKKYGGVNMYDLVFVGATNRSMCCIKHVKDLIATGKFASAMLKKGGYFLGSFFEDTAMPDTNNFDAEYSVHKIKYSGPYKGLWCHWGNITRREAFSHLHYYYPVVMLSNKKEIKSQRDIVHYFYSNNYESYQSWTHNVVVQCMEMAGLKLIEHNTAEPNGIFIVFQKQ